ncbi:hypothetical protein ElyMa_002053400 [Elysia marginata]|uniref:Uncharacterized protein n=1 Tax=Elysia marginata TaxID=1093978 RepID=A0AAV4F898_9GAST|nr:hypothetical protein ElyMa_002053400 [Elysia marginata]
MAKWLGMGSVVAMLRKTEDAPGVEKTDRQRYGAGHLMMMMMFLQSSLLAYLLRSRETRLVFNTRSLTVSLQSTYHYSLHITTVEHLVEKVVVSLQTGRRRRSGYLYHNDPRHLGQRLSTPSRSISLVCDLKHNEHQRRL